jgi:hypothetical protein
MEMARLRLTGSVMRRDGCVKPDMCCINIISGWKIADRRHKKKNRVIGGGDLMHAMNALQSAGQ